MFTPSPTVSVMDGLVAMLANPEAMRKNLLEIKDAQKNAEEALKKATEAQQELIEQKEDIDKKQKGLDFQAELLEKKEKNIQERENKLRVREQETQVLLDEAKAKVMASQENTDLAAKMLREASLIEDSLIAKKKELEAREIKLLEKENIVEAKLNELEQTRTELVRIANRS